MAARRLAVEDRRKSTRPGNERDRSEQGTRASKRRERRIHRLNFRETLGLLFGEICNALQQWKALSEFLRQVLDGHGSGGRCISNHVNSRISRGPDVVVQDQLGGALGQCKHLGHCQVRRAHWDDRAVHNTEVRDAVNAQVIVHHGVVVMFAHAASAATVVDRAPHVLPTSTILDGRCGITQRRRAADALRQLHSLPSPREVLGVRHRIMRNHRADIGGTAGESHRALGLRLAEGRADGEGVRLQGPRLALQGVLQRRGLRCIEERQEGQHEVRLRRRRVLLGRDRRAAPCCGLQDRAGVSRRVRLLSCRRYRGTHHL
mmetsp:Transcript_34600/g.99398  ORF Transcript_34600/g.99398 Transcript_34600/m.99398 type:complete len:318 (+) Transcript_34600:130-1083(+)